jgi:PAS domain-containing protein
MPYEKELAAALQWVDRTDPIAMEHFGIDMPFESKPDGTPVTAGDRAVEEQLRAAIGVMEDGFGLFDADDRIVLHNEAFMDEGSRKVFGNDVTGRKFEEIVRAFAYHDMPVTDPNFDREAWIANRMELHRNPPAWPIEVQWGGGRTMRISERRTADGGYVGIWTDISEIKLAEQRLTPRSG